MARQPNSSVVHFGFVSLLTCVLMLVTDAAMAAPETSVWKPSGWNYLQEH